MAAAGLKDLPKKIEKGARLVVAPESLATVGGFALSRVIEKGLYSGFRTVFGFNDGTQTPTQGQRVARTVSKVATAVLAGGLMVGSSNKHVRAAGVGLMAGSTWHALNDLGINV